MTEMAANPPGTVGHIKSQMQAFVWRLLDSRWKLIIRNVRKQKSRNMLLGALIMFSSFVIIYFSQFLAGVHQNFSQNLVALATGDVFISSKVTREMDKNIFERDYEYFRLTPPFADEIKHLPGVNAIAPRLEFDVKVATEIDSIPFRAMAFDRAVDENLYANFTLVEGRMFNKGAYEIIVPVDFARRNVIKVGDRIRLIATTLNKKVNLIDYEVTGLFNSISLSAWFDNYVYVDLAVARVLVDDPEAVTRLNISTPPDVSVKGVMEELRARLSRVPVPANPVLEPMEWQDSAQIFSELTGALQLSYVMIIVIITIMVAASLAFSTMLNILERTKEFATLAALGAAPKEIRFILVGETMTLALFAAASGVALAAQTYLITAEWGIPIENKELSGFLGSSHFFPAFNLSGYVLGIMLPLLVAFVSSYFFALRASKLPIAEALADR